MGSTGEFVGDEGPDAASPGETGERLVVGEIPVEPAAFIQREEFVAITKALARQRRSVLCAGGRGVGKSALAASYARMSLLDPQGPQVVVWISGETESLLMAGLGQVALRANAVEPGEDSLQAAQRGRDYLSSLGAAALLVVDNAEYPDDLAKWLPTGGCRVLLTSNDRRFDALARLVDIPDFTRVQSIDYLLRRTNIMDASGAAQLADALGDLPLALAQAAAVIVAQKLSYKRYFARLNESTLASSLQRIAGYPYLLDQAILLSVQEAHEQNPNARAVLDIMAVLDANGVGRELLRSLAVQIIPGVREHDVDEALGVAANMSLISLAWDGSMAVMHRLIGRVLREDLIARDGYAQLLEPVSRALGSFAIGEGEVQPSQLFSEIPVHALSVLRLAESAPDEVARRVADDVHRISRGAYLVGNRALIIDMDQQVLSLREQLLPEGHPDVLETREHLGDARYAAGQYAEALALDEQTLAVRERVHGREALATLWALHNLATDYRVVGRYADALVLDQRAVAARARALGPEHSDTLWSRQGLAIDYRLLGRYDEALIEDEQILDARQRATEPEPETIARALHCLAVDYRLAGRVEEALTLDELSLITLEQRLGKSHPDVLWATFSVALNYRMLGRLGGAQELNERTLDTRMRVLGAEHRDTLWSAHSLAIDWRILGRGHKALSLNERILAIRARVLGPNNPDTLSSRDSLAADYRLLGRQDEALRLDEQTLAIREQVLGQTHPETVIARTNLDRARRSTGLDPVTLPPGRRFQEPLW